MRISYIDITKLEHILKDAAKDSRYVSREKLDTLILTAKIESIANEVSCFKCANFIDVSSEVFDYGDDVESIQLRGIYCNKNPFCAHVPHPPALYCKKFVKVDRE